MTNIAARSQPGEVAPAGCFLSKMEISDLTGCKRVSGMTAWLRRHNWIFLESERRGQIPRVARQYFIQRMTGETSKAAPEPIAKPWFGFIEQIEKTRFR